MATAAGCSLRLARSSISPVKSRLNARGAVKRIEQRRWLQQRPPPQPQRPWAQRRDEPLSPQEHVSKRPRPRGQQDDAGISHEPAPTPEQPGRNTQLATTLAASESPDLNAPVSIPDDPHTVLPQHHPALSLLGNSSLVIQRQIEMMNVMLGFEQANRYIIMDGRGATLGYIAEQDHGIGSAMKRQAFKTHRSFTTHIFDAREREVLRIHRPFAWINSRIRIYDPVPPEGYEEEGDPGKVLQETGVSGVVEQSAGAKVSPLKLEDMRVIGEAQQQWAPLRRKYNLFAFRPFEDGEGMLTLESGQRLSAGNQRGGDVTATEAGTGDEAIERGMVQFASVNEPFLSWDFHLRDQQDGLVGSVNRNFSGFAREIFTDTGVYALRMDSAAQQGSVQEARGMDVQAYEREAKGMSLDQRAVMLATAVSIDFDYFSRHSGHASGGFMPFFWPMGGAGAEAGGAGAAGGGAAGAGAGAEAGAVGAAEAEGAAGAVGAAGRGAAGMGTAAESGMVGAGTMAGYEAMQRGAYGGGRGSGVDDASPQAPPPPNEPYAGAGGAQDSQNQPGNDVWGEDQDPWGGDGGPPGAGGAGDGGSGGGEGGGGGLFDAISDFFGD